MTKCKPKIIWRGTLLASCLIGCILLIGIPPAHSDGSNHKRLKVRNCVNGYDFGYLNSYNGNDDCNKDGIIFVGHTSNDFPGYMQYTSLLCHPLGTGRCYLWLQDGGDNSHEVCHRVNSLNSGHMKAVVIVDENTFCPLKDRATRKETSSNKVDWCIYNQEVPPLCEGDDDRWVFVTDSVYNGNLGGIDGADLICQSEADAAGLSGTYKAWLGTGSASPDNRFDDETINNAAFFRPDGTNIAKDWGDLTDGSINAPINLNANGQSKDLYRAVWTNVAADGSMGSSSQNCNGWTSNGSGESGWTGQMKMTDSTWTDYLRFGVCSDKKRLYCFEQQRRSTSPTTVTIYKQALPNPSGGTSECLMATQTVLLADNGYSKLYWQKDGNLVLRDSTGKAKWSSGTVGSNQLCFKENGNLVIYDGNPTWKSGTKKPAGHKLVLESNCNLVIRSSSGALIWDKGIRSCY